MVELLFGPPGTLPLKTTHLTIIILLVATLILLDIYLKCWFPMRQMLLKISSVQFSRSVMSDSSQLHEPQLTRPPWVPPTTTPRVHQNPCPLSWWSHPTISSSVIPFSSCRKSFPASGSFQMSQFSASAGQSIGASTSGSVPSVNIQDWFPLGWTGWISLQSKGLSGVFNSTVQKHQFFDTQPSLWSDSSICTCQLEKP